MQQDHAVAEVAAFDQPLGATKHLSEPAEFTDGVFAHVFQFVGAFGAEAGEHDVVIERQELADGAGIALAAAAAGELSVDAGGVVQFGADHVQAAQFDHVRGELDVGAAARHVGRHGHFAL